jgi:hypothetical protein
MKMAHARAALTGACAAAAMLLGAAGASADEAKRLVVAQAEDSNMLPTELEPDPAMQDDGVMGDPSNPVDPSTGAAIKSGDMRVRSGGKCDATFDPKTNTRIYLCVNRNSDACQPVTDVELKNRPGATYRWICPAPTVAKPAAQ